MLTTARVREDRARLLFARGVCSYVCHYHVTYDTEPHADGCCRLRRRPTITEDDVAMFASLLPIALSAVI